MSKIETGQLAQMRLDRIRAVFGALDARLTITAKCRGAEIDRLLDERHAALVERCVGKLRSAGWSTEIEVSYSRYGERGSIDILGVRQDARAVLVVEVKSDLVSIEGTVRPMDAKARPAPAIAIDRFGWRPKLIGRLLVLPELSAARRRVASHAETLEAAFPARGMAVRGWLGRPAGALSGLIFLSPMSHQHGKGLSVAPHRVRRPRDRDS